MAQLIEWCYCVDSLTCDSQWPEAITASASIEWKEWLWNQFGRFAAKIQTIIHIEKKKLFGSPTAENFLNVSLNSGVFCPCDSVVGEKQGWAVTGC